MLLMVKSVLDLMLLTLFIAMLCLQVTISQMNVNLIGQESSISAVQQISLTTSNFRENNAYSN